MDQNRRFCELAGLCWHEEEPYHDDDRLENYRCKKCGMIWLRIHPLNNCINPDYAADPREVLKAMMGRDDKEEFCTYLNMYSQDGFEYGEASAWIEENVLDTNRPCRIFLMAKEWMKGHPKGGE